MGELIYIDSNVYLDYLESRVDRLRPLGEFALRLFQRALECEFKVVVSELVTAEVEKHQENIKVKELLNDLKKNNKIVNVGITHNDKKKAGEIIKTKKTHFGDALHAVLAQKAKAKFLITRNIEHFADLQDLVDIRYPESI